MEAVLHITFDCPTENLDPTTVGDMAAKYLERGLGLTVYTAAVDLPELVVVAGPEWGSDGDPTDDEDTHGYSRSDLLFGSNW